MGKGLGDRFIEERERESAAGCDNIVFETLEFLFFEAGVLLKTA